MKVRYLITETPKMIPDLEHLERRLGNFSSNHQENKKYKSKYLRSITKISDKIEIFWSKKEFFGLDKDKQLITYYMQWDKSEHAKLGEYVWQILVWSSPTTLEMRGKAADVFFDHLLPKVGMILTDSKQTWHGKRWWQLRIVDAFQRNLNVYFFDFADDTLIKVDDIDHFQQIQEKFDIWGDTDLHEMKRMVITRKVLTV